MILYLFALLLNVLLGPKVWAFLNTNSRSYVNDLKAECTYGHLFISFCIGILPGFNVIVIFIYLSIFAYMFIIWLVVISRGDRFRNLANKKIFPLKKVK
jgi:hypothetical protein